jgi:hypothetical protein
MTVVVLSYWAKGDLKMSLSHAMHFMRVGLFSLLAGAAVAVMTGCGSSGGPLGGSPNAATRAAIHNIFSKSLNSAGQSGSLASSPGGGSVGSGNFDIGGFIRNIGGASRASRTARIHRSHITRAENFYFDEYVNLWVLILDEPGKTTYLFYEDEQKAKPAGSVVTTFPADFDADATSWSYSSTYSFTAGSMKGTHGSYNSIQNADGSGSWSYESATPDGYITSGQSTFAADGASSWSSHTEGPGGTYNSRGAYRSDGFSTMHTDSSDGHSTDFTWNPDGSGNAKIGGPEPGLPAIIVWDSQGNGSITYADGTKETWTDWSFFIVSIGDGGGDSSGGDTGGGTSLGVTSKAARIHK